MEQEPGPEKRSGGRLDAGWRGTITSGGSSPMRSGSRGFRNCYEGNNNVHLVAWYTIDSVKVGDLRSMSARCTARGIWVCESGLILCFQFPSTLRTQDIRKLDERRALEDQATIKPRQSVEQGTKCLQLVSISPHPPASRPATSPKVSTSLPSPVQARSSLNRR